jgi:DNA (cytosine-5)-methyltransferase 1
MEEKLNGLDLFSGIGGISQALAPWVRTVAYCERDRYAQAVLLSRMERGEIDTAPIWDDVTTLKVNPLPFIDIVSGGFPCQDLSLAGLRKGLAGERSGLFFEIMRLVRELQPRFVFMENVAGIFAGYTLGTVGGALAALGYDCRWGVLSAYDVGAPHQRERWFCLGHPTSHKFSWTRLENGKTNCRGTGKGKKKAGKFCRPRFKVGNTGSDIQGGGGEGSWPNQPDIQRVVNGVSNQQQRLKCLGNGVVPQQVQEAFQRLAGLR